MNKLNSKKKSKKSSKQQEEPKTYYVEKILDKKKINGAFFYKVKWKNFPDSSCTWEPKENFEDMEVINQYELERKEDLINKKRKRETSTKNNDEDSTEEKVEKGKITEDIPLKIISAKQNIKNPKDLLCLVEWKKRKDGVKPENSEVKNSVLRKKFPILLLDFYEDQLTFPDKQKNFKK